MLNFSREVYVTGAVRKRSTKDREKEYTLVTVLGDDGVSESCLYLGSEECLKGLEVMKKYNVAFCYTGGKYPRLEIVSVEGKK